MLMWSVDNDCPIKMTELIDAEASTSLRSMRISSGIPDEKPRLQSICNSRTEYIDSDIGCLRQLTTKRGLYKDEYIEFLKWLILHNFKWDKYTKQIAFEAEMYELLLWTKQNKIMDTYF